MEDEKDLDQVILDQYYMSVALKEAMKAYEINEVPIGAVIVYKGKIIGKGYNRRNIDKSTFAHAEIMAMKEAGTIIKDWRLEETTMYVTLEPCPMCAGAIVQARIPRVVIGAPNHKAGSAGSVVNLLEEPGFNHQVEVLREVMLKECREVLQCFFRKLRLEKSEIKAKIKTKINEEEIEINQEEKSSFREY